MVSSLLQRIPTIFSHVKNPEPAVLPALNAALSALQATGGKVVCSVASLPTASPGKLVMREDPKLHGTDAEKKLFNTEHQDWKKTGSKLAEAGIGVDMFIAAPGGVYMDVATMGELALRKRQVMKATNVVNRLRFRCHWWRDILLSELPFPQRSAEAIEGTGTCCHP